MSFARLEAQLPDDFQKVDLITGLSNATNFKFAPDSRIFILDRYGEVLIYKQSTQTTVSAGTLSVFHELEDGLLGIAFDPNFTSNSHIYLHYSPLLSNVNRISRFTMSGDFIDMSSEITMIEFPTMRSAFINHSGGDMDFDSQGNLYIAIGDNSIHSNYGALHEVNPANSAEKSSSNTNDLRGKILRITPQPSGTYTIPSGNLFPGGTGGLPEIYVMGARNPYRIFVDKDRSDWLFWGEVGPDANSAGSQGPEGLDEINLTKNAGNYGWPYFSGVDNDAYLNSYSSPNFYYNPTAPVNVSQWNTGVTNLPPAQPALLEFFHKSHFAGPRYSFDVSLSDQQRLPAEFDDVFFYYDFNTSRIWGITLDANGNVLTNEQIAPSVFPVAQDGFIDMKIGPDGHMYILAYGTGCCPNNTGTGRLIRVDYTGVVTNSPPVVEVAALPTSGSLPLTVNFSSAGTIDPNGDTPLSYAWDFNSDGVIDSTLENPTFTYTTAGTFNAQLKVDDGNGGIGVKNTTIYAGNTSASFVFNSPPDGGLVGWNDDISFDMDVTDVEDGVIDCNTINVVPSLGHLNHFHDDLTLTGCPQTITLADAGHDIDGEMDIYFVLGANYTDQGGLTSFDQIILHPKRKEAEFYDSENDVAVIDNTDATQGGSEAIRVNSGSHISFSGRNLLNMNAVKYRVATSNTGGTIEFRLGSPTGTLLSTTTVPPTGSLENWVDVESAFVAPVGKNDLFFVFKNASVTQNIFDLNFVEFIGNGVSIDNSPPDIDSFTALSTTQTIINFNEYVTQASAETVSNYAINNGIAVVAAALQPNGRSVLIDYNQLTAGITYQLTVQNIANEAGLLITPQVLSLSLFDPIAINSGGPTTQATPNDFMEDQYATGGSLFSNVTPIGSTTDDAIYQTERFGNFSYNIPVSEPGEYDIRLHFAELYFGLLDGGSGGVGSRIFNVTIEGNPVLTDFDISSEVSPATALQKELNDVSITDGFATIVFASVVENPKVSAIEILPSNTFDANPNASITIHSPSQGADVNQQFDVAFAVENWTIAEGNTHMHYYIDDVMVGPHYSYEPIAIEGLSLGNHTIKVELFNANHTGTGILDEITINVTGAVTCNSTPFPDQWVVKQLETTSLPTVSVYTFADFDLDGDGLKDIVTGAWWYKNPGTIQGNWVRSTIGTDFDNVVWVHDFDGDGSLDLLGTKENGTDPRGYEGNELVWAQNDGAGGFTVFSNIPSGNTTYVEPFVAGVAGGVFTVGGPYQMAVNWNGAENTGSPMELLTPSTNPATGTWSLETLTMDSTGEDIQAGDIDQDNDLDLFQGSNWIENDLSVSGNWVTHSTGITYPTTPDRAQLADFDRDGDLDAVVGQLSAFSTAPNRKEFSWFAAPADPTQPWVRNVLDTDISGSLSVFATDIDFDGDKDIVVGEWRDQYRLIAFENDLCDSGNFIKTIINAGIAGQEHHDGARVTDLDNDGDLDIISNGWFVGANPHNFPRIYENTTVITTQSPIASAGSDQSITLPVSSLTLDGSGNDPDGGLITAYEWTQQSGPNTASLSGTTTADLTASNLVEGIYVFRLTVTDDEDDTGFDEVLLTVNPELTGGFSLRINTGGSTTNYSGEDFIADQFFDTGATLDRPQTGLPEPYQTFRFSRSQVMGYDIPVADGEYTVRLHFAELWFGATGGGAGGVGSRVFDVSMEGQLVEDNLDVFAEVGADAMLIRTHTVSVTGGILNIDFSSLPGVGGNRHPIINAIEILGAEQEEMVITNFLLKINDDPETGYNFPFDPVITDGIRYAEGISGNLNLIDYLENISIDYTGSVSSVRFAHTGPDGYSHERIDNDAPFTVYQEQFMRLGENRVTATPHSGPNGSGQSGIQYEVNFDIYNPCLEAIDASYVIVTNASSCNDSNGSATLVTTLALEDTGVQWSGGVESIDGLSASGLSPGTYTVSFSNSNCGSSLQFVVEADEVCTDPQNEIWLEAECANVGANWSVINDASASEGVYLLAPSGNNYSSGPTDTNSIVSYDFTANAGTYKVYARVSVPSQEDDSFWVRVNGGTWLRWNLIPGNSAFSWHQVHDRENNTAFLTFDLPSGTNTIDIGHREDGAGIDKLYVTKTTSIPSGFGGVDANCSITTQAPIANTGSNQSITLPSNSIVLNGLGNDPDGGSIIEYEWTQESGPNTASLSGASTTDLTASNLVEGVYVFRLTVTDDENETGFDEVSVLVNPEMVTQSPIASAGSDQSITLPVNSLTLNGSGNDPDGGSITAYEWTQQSGPNTASLLGAATADLTVSNLVEGLYVFRLTVTDEEDDTGFDEVSLTVNPELTGGFSLRINTGGSATNYSGEDFISDQFFDTGVTLDRPQTGLPEPYQTFRFSRSQVMGYDIPVADGEYTVMLHFAELWFGATGGGTGGVGSRVFDVSIEGQLIEDNLDVFGEVGADAMLIRTHTVTVTGGVLNIDFSALPAVGGNRHPIINAIEVLGSGSTSQAPTANAGLNQSITLPTNSLTLNGSGNDPDGGSITGYEWTQRSGPNTASLSGATTTDLTPSNLVEGTYVFRLTVTDDENETGFDEVTVTVDPEVTGNPDEIWLEAECAVVGSNWSVINDVSASEGWYTCWLHREIIIALHQRIQIRLSPMISRPMLELIRYMPVSGFPVKKMIVFG